MLRRGAALLLAVATCAAARSGGRPAYLTHAWMDVFSPPDLGHWARHALLLDVKDVSCTASMANGRYYLFLAANDVHPGEVGGIDVVVADRPPGPFRGLSASR